LLARNFVDQLSLALVNIELRERLQNMAIKDPLTELYNRRFLDEALARELLIAERKRAKVCVAMIDIDHFKKVNDTYGHPAGDAILKQVARYLVGMMRRSDIVCRYGGEEMLVVMPDCDLNEGAKKANALRDGIKALTLRSDGVEIPSITASIGVAVYPDHATDRVELVSAADQALYQAKRTGRDRVVLADQVDETTIAAS
jgi:diguanylate cyclase (GGDEF)-like protein